MTGTFHLVDPRCDLPTGGAARARSSAKAATPSSPPVELEAVARLPIVAREPSDLMRWSSPGGAPLPVEAAEELERRLTSTWSTARLISRGGFNVFPREVEEALLEGPARPRRRVVGLATCATRG